jgi:uncharacterized protein (TIGR03435 family)
MLPLIAVRAVAFGLLGSLTPLCGAQVPASSSSTFIVATIKPSDPNRAEDDGSIGFSPHGLKIKPSTKAGDEDLGSAERSPGNWKGDGVTMEQLASNLSALPEVGGRIVTDKTGLKGRFDFTLKWTPDPTMGATPPGPDSGVKSDSSAPSLLTALQEQLGLKLEMAKEPVDVIVIDSAELPTPN